VKLDAWLKNTPVGFYFIEYAWKKGEHPKRGEFSPDFFLKQGKQIFIIEIKGDEEIKEPAPENIKKNEYAQTHFQRLNEWLEKEGQPKRYQFNMLTPTSYNIFFQKLRENDLSSFRSEVDVAMQKAVGDTGSDRI
jgi:type III restriction enzyme